MMTTNDTTYARCGGTVTNPKLARDWGAGAVIRWHAELHAIGDQAPYFAVGAEVRGPLGEGGGCMHAEVLAHVPDAAPLIALHLSDYRGVPMHAEANALYWLAGMTPGHFGERHHGGNGTSPKSPDECAATLAAHLRVSVDQAREMAASVTRGCPEPWRPEYGSALSRDALRRAINAMRPRWQEEAEAGIRWILERCAPDLRAEFERRVRELPEVWPSA
jgi:hypothetical protein